MYVVGDANLCMSNVHVWFLRFLSLIPCSYCGKWLALVEAPARRWVIVILIEIAICALVSIFKHRPVFEGVLKSGVFSWMQFRSAYHPVLYCTVPCTVSNLICILMWVLFGKNVKPHLRDSNQVPSAYREDALTVVLQCSSCPQRCHYYISPSCLLLLVTRITCFCLIYKL